MAITAPPPAPPWRARRLVGTVAVAVVAAAALVTGPVDAQAPADAADPGPTAAAWLAGQLVDGERLETTFDGTAFPDQGLTADAVLAFAAAGVAETQAAAATAWLARPEVTDAYIGDGTDAAYAGATAKLALVAQVRGLDATSWGPSGLDLIARLTSLEQPDGRFADLSDFGDFSNPIGQSLAVIALVRQPGVAPSDAALDLLLAGQCADGGFDQALEPDPTTCASAVDATAFAAQALIAADRPGDAEAIAAALGFLERAQRPGGGFGTTATDTPNANSTGVAAQALAVGGRSGPVAAARAYLATLQVGCAGEPAARGAVAFDAQGFDPANAPRATAQAVLGLVGAGVATISAAGATAALPSIACVAPPAPPPPLDLATTPPAQPVVAAPTFTG